MLDPEVWAWHEGVYRMEVHHVGGAGDLDAPRRTQWTICHLHSGEQVASGWAPTPRAAHEAATRALDRLAREAS